MIRQRQRFRGLIAGVGSTSGIRVVLGHWAETPFGAFSDAMVALPGGHRVLLAGSTEVAQFIAATYDFHETRIEPFQITVTGDTWQVRSQSLVLDLTTGERTWIGRLLRLVPRPLREALWWTSATDPVARVVMAGVRTKGHTRDRREWYNASDNHRVITLAGTFDGADLGQLAQVDPPPAFGPSSTPRRPSVTEMLTTVEFTTD